MTVEVGILNKQGIALAADSAVTIGNGRGYYNTANKLFALSKYEPVAIMVYSNAEFMGIPIETIVKEYRKQLNDRKFDYLKDYWSDFLSYLNTFCTERIQNNMDFYFREVCDFVEYIHKKITIEVDQYSEYSEKEIPQDEINRAVSDIIISNIRNIKEEYNNFEDDNEFKDKFTQIYDTVNVEVDEIIKSYFGQEFPEELIEMIRESSILLLTKKHNMGTRTGIVITGFGEKEIFPSLINGEFLGCFFEKLKYSLINDYTIDHNNDAAIFPFAQQDVINTFMTGIDDNIINSILHTINNSTVLSDCGNNSTCKEKLINEILENVHEASHEFHSNPIINTVSVAPKEELAQMAETLVNLTSFRRKLALDMYSQTVGGPIDVAIITKGDGLIWLKRKHYFDKELNYRFYDNYYN